MKILYISLCLVAGIVLAHGAQKPLNKTECVEWHNHYRKMHKAPDVEWSDQLEADAQGWSNNLASKDIFEHSTTNNGENLYKSSGDSDHSCRNAIKSFYKEEKNYNYKTGKFGQYTGHFTQLVWIKSTKIGVGKAMTGNGAIVLVFRYQPAGNVAGQFLENVKPKAGGKAFLHTASYCTILFTVFTSMIGQYLL